jgi:hypothetical protein
MALNLSGNCDAQRYEWLKLLDAIMLTDDVPKASWAAWRQAESDLVSRHCCRGLWLIDG